MRTFPLAALKDLQPVSQKIRVDSDVDSWRTTSGYRDYVRFLNRLTGSVRGVFLPYEPQSLSNAVSKTIDMLETLSAWIDEIPPLDTPQRFGNLAFRTWGRKLEEEADNLLKALLPASHVDAGLIPLIKPYLLISFGSFVRMDYGTGHETSFSLFLLCLCLGGFYSSGKDEDQALVLVVFLRYLRLCWRLQDVYKLEPAGSHGVWGLDDSHFLPYVLGSGQLLDSTDTIPVSSVLKKELPPSNLYFLSIARIHEVKTGPFHEHSSQLHAIATGVPNWGKVNSGLFKMYEAEVLGKQVVVQHLPLGGLIQWDVKDASTNQTRATFSPSVSDGPVAGSLPTLKPRAKRAMGPPR